MIISLEILYYLLLAMSISGTIDYIDLSEALFELADGNLAIVALLDVARFLLHAPLDVVCSIGA